MERWTATGGVVAERVKAAPASSDSSLCVALVEGCEGCSEQDLRAAFRNYGPVPWSNKLDAGRYLVRFASREALGAATKDLDGTSFHGNTLRVGICPASGHLLEGMQQDSPMHRNGAISTAIEEQTDYFDLLVAESSNEQPQRQQSSSKGAGAAATPFYGPLPELEPCNAEWMLPRSSQASSMFAPLESQAPSNESSSHNLQAADGPTSCQLWTQRSIGSAARDDLAKIAAAYAQHNQQDSSNNNLAGVWSSSSNAAATAPRLSEPAGVSPVREVPLSPFKIGAAGGFAGLAGLCRTSSDGSVSISKQQHLQQLSSLDPALATIWSDNLAPRLPNDLGLGSNDSNELTQRLGLNGNANEPLLSAADMLSLQQGLLTAAQQQQLLAGVSPELFYVLLAQAGQVSHGFGGNLDAMRLAATSLAAGMNAGPDSAMYAGHGVPPPPPPPPHYAVLQQKQQYALMRHQQQQQQGLMTRPPPPPPREGQAAYSAAGTSDGHVSGAASPVPAPPPRVMTPGGNAAVVNMWASPCASPRVMVPGQGQTPSPGNTPRQPLPPARMFQPTPSNLGQSNNKVQTAPAATATLAGQQQQQPLPPAHSTSPLSGTLWDATSAMPPPPPRPGYAAAAAKAAAAASPGISHDALPVPPPLASPVVHVRPGAGAHTLLPSAAQLLQGSAAWLPGLLQSQGSAPAGVTGGTMLGTQRSGGLTERLDRLLGRRSYGGDREQQGIALGSPATAEAGDGDVATARDGTDSCKPAASASGAGRIVYKADGVLFLQELLHLLKSGAATGNAFLLSISDLLDCALVARDVPGGAIAAAAPAEQTAAEAAVLKSSMPMDAATFLGILQEAAALILADGASAGPDVGRRLKPIRTDCRSSHTGTALDAAAEADTPEIIGQTSAVQLRQGLLSRGTSGSVSSPQPGSTTALAGPLLANGSYAGSGSTSCTPRSVGSPMAAPCMQDVGPARAVLIRLMASAQAFVQSAAYSTLVVKLDGTASVYDSMHDDPAVVKRRKCRDMAVMRDAVLKDEAFAQAVASVGSLRNHIYSLSRKVLLGCGLVEGLPIDLCLGGLTSELSAVLAHPASLNKQQRNNSSNGGDHLAARGSSIAAMAAHGLHDAGSAADTDDSSDMQGYLPESVLEFFTAVLPLPRLALLVFTEFLPVDPAPSCLHLLPPEASAVLAGPANSAQARRLNSGDGGSGRNGGVDAKGGSVALKGPLTGAAGQSEKRSLHRLSRDGDMAGQAWQATRPFNRRSGLSRGNSMNNSSAVGAAGSAEGARGTDGAIQGHTMSRGDNGMERTKGSRSSSGDGKQAAS